MYKWSLSINEYYDNTEENLKTIENIISINDMRLGKYHYGCYIIHSETQYNSYKEAIDSLQDYVKAHHVCIQEISNLTLNDIELEIRYNGRTHTQLTLQELAPNS